MDHVVDAQPCMCGLETVLVDMQPHAVPARSRWFPLIVGLMATVVGMGLAGNLTAPPEAGSDRDAEVDVGEPVSPTRYEIVVTGIVPAGSDGIVVKITDESERTMETTLEPRGLPAVFGGGPIEQGWAVIHGTVTMP